MEGERVHRRQHRAERAAPRGVAPVDDPSVADVAGGQHTLPECRSSCCTESGTGDAASSAHQSSNAGSSAVSRSRLLAGRARRPPPAGRPARSTSRRRSRAPSPRTPPTTPVASTLLGGLRQLDLRVGVPHEHALPDGPRARRAARTSRSIGPASRLSDQPRSTSTASTSGHQPRDALGQQPEQRGLVPVAGAVDLEPDPLLRRRRTGSRSTTPGRAAAPSAPVSRTPSGRSDAATQAPPRRGRRSVVHSSTDMGPILGVTAVSANGFGRPTPSGGGVASISALSVARSVRTAAASASNASSVTPGPRRSVNTTSQPAPSGSTRIGLVTVVPSGSVTSWSRTPYGVLRGEADLDLTHRGVREPPAVPLLDGAARGPLPTAAGAPGRRRSGTPPRRCGRRARRGGGRCS